MLQEMLCPFSQINLQSRERGEKKKQKNRRARNWERRGGEAKGVGVGGVCVAGDSRRQRSMCLCVCLACECVFVKEVAISARKINNPTSCCVCRTLNVWNAWIITEWGRKGGAEEGGGGELTLYIKCSLNSSGWGAVGGRGQDECMAKGGRGGKNQVTQHFYLLPLKLPLLPHHSHKAVQLTYDLSCPCPGSCPNCRMPPINFSFFFFFLLLSIPSL